MVVSTVLERNCEVNFSGTLNLDDVRFRDYEMNICVPFQMFFLVFLPLASSFLTLFTASVGEGGRKEMGRGRKEMGSRRRQEEGK